MNNKNLAIGALIVVLLSGLIMYVTKPSETETQAQSAPVIEETPVSETAAAESTEVESNQPEEIQADATAFEESPESLGASSSGLGR